ncbi:hypothetical protein VUR80DRAFT_10197 [Thermomyces stellatus]
MGQRSGGARTLAGSERTGPVRPRGGSIVRARALASTTTRSVSDNPSSAPRDAVVLLYLSLAKGHGSKCREIRIAAALDQSHVPSTKSLLALCLQGSVHSQGRYYDLHLSGKQETHEGQIHVPILGTDDYHPSGIGAGVMCESTKLRTTTRPNRKLRRAPGSGVAGSRRHVRYLAIKKQSPTDINTVRV